jgi:hypothetical protein
MRSTRILATVGAIVLVLAGCSVHELPRYEQVRSETLDVLQQVADLVPEPKEISKTPEFKPYPCDDELALGNRPGAFYTGQWKVFVDESFDVDEFVQNMPTALGEGWSEAPLGLPLSFAQVRLVRDSPRMTLTVEASLPGDRKAVELLGMSRCGSNESPES